MTGTATPQDALAGINSRVFDRIARLPMPTVAAVNGPAVGGAELAYACDFRLASERAFFGNPEVGRCRRPGSSSRARSCR